MNRELVLERVPGAEARKLTRRPSKFTAVRCERLAADRPVQCPAMKNGPVQTSWRPFNRDPRRPRESSASA